MKTIMMQIVYFSQKDQLLDEIAAQETGAIFITPSPLKADNLRTQLRAESGQDVITISKFTGDLLATLWPSEESRPMMKRKSELLLVFGILKNKYFPELGFEQFNQAYNLFSDLRSYTLNIEALSPVLDEQTEDVSKAVKLFWMLLEAMNFVDEHGAYHTISEELRAHDEVPELKKTFVFWGFQHLNGQQIDLIKSLAIRYRVLIPFPASLKESIKRSDWISWILDHKVEEKVLPLVEKNPQAEWLTINSREISRKLKEKCTAGTQVILGLSKLSSHHIDIVPFTDVNFKIPHEILMSEIIEVSHKLRADQPKVLGDWLNSEMTMELAKAKECSFKKIKVLQLYQEALTAVDELTDTVPTPDSFFQKLLKEVVVLNQPRTSYIPTLKTVASIELKDMSTIEDIDRSKPVILCVDDRFDDFQGLGQAYTETIQKVLASLGPIKRNELDLLFKQWEMIDLFSTAKVLVMMPESVLKHSLVWKKVFSKMTLNKISSDHSVAPRVPLDYFKDLPRKAFEGNLSASKFQNFYDCPRKFYYNYVEKISPSVTIERDIDAKIMGTMVHRIIEIYFERNAQDSQISSIAQEVFNEEIQKSHLSIPRDTYSERLLIFTHRATNGISLLRKLAEVTGQKINWKIEFGFDYQETYQVKGSMDCVGISDTHIYLLDFKSTDSSAASNKDVTGIEQLQLWVYALAAQKKIPEFANRSLVFGYVVLDEPKKSNIFFVDADLFKTVKEAAICSPAEWKTDMPEDLIKAKTKLDTIAAQIAAENQFPARPRNGDACTYCDLSPVCIKGESRV